MPSTGEPLIVIWGPTAVGKTGLALDVAQALGGEIVGADSRQVYRRMDIGTAKPDAAQQARVRHHLIDVVDPDENLSLSQYLKLAYAAIGDVHTRGKLPLLVGGTGQYITALVEGWTAPEVPPDNVLRAELEAFAAAHGAQALHNRLRALDDAAADAIDYRNVRRVVRALEVCTLTGEKFSAQQRRTPPPYRIYAMGLTLERQRLYAQANARVDAMLAQGWLDEVRALLDAGYARTLPAMSGLGYRQLAAHLLDGMPLVDAVTLTQHATHDFIRRQYTWFRGHDHATLWHNRDELRLQVVLDDLVHWLEAA